jgi:hypothetical protein
VNIHTKCVECGKGFDIPSTKEQYRRWIQGEYVQNVFPELDAGTRELLISGICNECWDNIFAFMDQD